MTRLNRRHFMGLCAAGALPAFGGCANPLPLTAVPPAQESAATLRWLSESAEHHGWQRFNTLQDINVAYAGRWRPLIDRIQPEVVDKPWRESSEERLLPRQRFIAQAHRGSAGQKQVVRASGMNADDLGTVAVWYADRPASSPSVLTASALVADCYQLFLLGPLWLAQRTAAPGQARVALAGRVEVDGHECQWLQAWVNPGLGQVARDRVDLAIDVRDRTTRRMRFTLEGFAGTRGAVAETDTFEHQRHAGILWPMRSFERVVHPIGLAAHDWRITGLDVDRGYGLADVQGPLFTGAAVAPARRPATADANRPSPVA